MVGKADQERVKTLLRDTITLLCKNGLTFKTKFSIDAVIGVTLDEDDVFLVSMNEIVQSEASILAKQAEAELRENANSDKERHAEYRRRKRKRKFAIKKERLGSEDEEVATAGSSEADDHDHFAENGSKSALASPGGEPPAKLSAISSPRDSNDDSKDVVYIKEELEESWGEIQGESSSQFNLPDFSTQFPPNLNQTDPGLPSLSGMNLVPVGSQSWMSSGQPTVPSAPRMYRPPMKPHSSATITSDELQQQQQSDDPSSQGQMVEIYPAAEIFLPKQRMEHMMSTSSTRSMFALKIFRAIYTKEQFKQLSSIRHVPTSTTSHIINCALMYHKDSFSPASQEERRKISKALCGVFHNYKRDKAKKHGTSFHQSPK